MAFDANTPVVNVAPRMSKTAFAAWLQSVKSPAADTASAGYDAIVANHCDPLFCAACFWHESNAATNPKAIVVQYQTNNPGNCRTSRTGSGTVITTPRGQFVKYPNWYEGWRDLAFRLIDPTYAYAQGGCTTPGKIIPKFAPSEDGNDPNGYLQSVLTFMNQHADLETGDTAPVAIVWYPDAKRASTPYQNDGPSNGRHFPATVTDVVMHHTDGSYASAIAWFQKPGRGDSGTSAHFVISRSGEVTQLVPLDAIAWHAGNWAENVKSVGIEHEQAQVNGQWQDWPDALLNASAKLLTWLMGQMTAGFNVYPHKNFTSTTCPGNLPIDEIVKRIGQPATTPAQPASDPNAYQDPDTHLWIINQGDIKMLDAWRAEGGEPKCGKPLTGMTQDDDGVYRQYFENLMLEIWPNGWGGHPGPYARVGGLGQRYVALLQAKK